MRAIDPKVMMRGGPDDFIRRDGADQITAASQVGLAEQPSPVRHTRRHSAPATTAPALPPPYISPRLLARRWCVSRSTVDRIAHQNVFTRFLAGSGRNGTVRYLLEEVIRYEHSRLIASAA